MRFVEPPPLKPSDDLEALLRAFFRSQMPQSWPSPRVPFALGRTELIPFHGRSLIRSRWALAASVALLLLGSLLLPSRFTHDANPENRISAPAISSDDIHQKMDREHKNREFENKIKSGLAAEDDDRLPEMDDVDLPFMK
ncbi:MAG: hypothetical protein ACRELG_20020 [Gemmataceae bacterium]